MSLRAAIEELPSDARDVLRAYMARAERIDHILVALTRQVCARCPRNAEYGCCDFAGEGVREMPAEAIRLQEAECIENGGNPQLHGAICRYHMPAGCSLRLTKSSSCLGHLCDDLREYLTVKFAADAEPFIAAMRKLVTGSLKQASAELLAAMDEAIALGSELVEACQAADHGQCNELEHTGGCNGHSADPYAGK